jgi:hypothetical protein
MSEPFIADIDRNVNFGRTILVTSTGTATFYPMGGTAFKISVRGAAVYYQWGVAQNTTPTNNTAATQMDWLPQNAVVRMSRPQPAFGSYRIPEPLVYSSALGGAFDWPLIKTLLTGRYALSAD